MYIYNGTVFLVSDEPGAFPDRKFITLTGTVVRPVVALGSETSNRTQRSLYSER